MARDLIPPPSPAGRPESPGTRSDPQQRTPHQWLAGGEASPHARVREEPREVVAEPPRELPRLAPDSPYRPRFGFLFGALIGVLIAAALLAYAIAGSAGTGAPEGWSAWKPSTSDRLGAAEQIAAHVAPKYRLSNGDQMVMIEAGPLEIQGLPLGVVIRTAPVGGNIVQIPGDHGVMYTLNGLGPRGSIREGAATQERHLLLRREALELALLTFRYAKHTDLVIVLLPPKPPQTGQTLAEAAAENPVQALVYRPGDLRAQLEARTLTVTVPESPTPRPDNVQSEAPRIDPLTRPNLFRADVEPGQNAHLLLILDPLRTG